MSVMWEAANTFERFVNLSRERVLMQGSGNVVRPACYAYCYIQDTNQFIGNHVGCHIHNTQYNTGIIKNIYTYINKFELV